MYTLSNHPYGKLHSTLVPEMKYAQLGKDWRFITIQGGAVASVGPYYPTKELLLADMRRYLTEYGYSI